VACYQGDFQRATDALNESLEPCLGLSHPVGKRFPKPFDAPLVLPVRPRARVEGLRHVSEARLLALGYAFEQATRKRVAPDLTR